MSHQRNMSVPILAEDLRYHITVAVYHTATVTKTYVARSADIYAILGSIAKIKTKYTPLLLEMGLTFSEKGLLLTA
ncbi:hypothetical protein GJV44_00488 [Candidatus Vallotia cooleyia]|nr:hypothetical protein GJV44_00488 [Candidatus Vallotia cooleyia]